jgi:hypothetical protein
MTLNEIGRLEEGEEVSVLRFSDDMILSVTTTLFDP